MVPPRCSNKDASPSAPTATATATLADFAARLSGLTLNSRPLIDSLTSAAAEIAAGSIQGATAVADAVVERAATVRGGAET